MRESIYLDASGPHVNLDAGRPGGSFVKIRPEAVPFARAWERACAEASRHDVSGPMGLLDRYIRPIMHKALERADAFPEDPFRWLFVGRRMSPPRFDTDADMESVTIP